MTSSDRKPSNASSGTSVFVAGNLTILIMMLAFVLFPAFSQVSGPPYDSMTVFGMQAPAMCFSKTWLDVECVTCGLTRCFSLVAHGRLGEAFQVHFLGPILYACMLAEALFRGAVLIKGPDWVKPPFPRLHILLWVAMIAALVFYWVLKLFAS